LIPLPVFSEDLTRRKEKEFKQVIQKVVLELENKSQSRGTNPMNQESAGTQQGRLSAVEEKKKGTHLFAFGKKG